MNTLLKPEKDHYLGLSVLRGNPGRDSTNEYLLHSRDWILESENVTEIGALYDFSIEDDYAAQARERSLLGHFMFSEEIPGEILQ